MPNVDINENKENYTLSFEIPGIAREDVRIWIEKDMLMISGEKKQDLKKDEVRHLGRGVSGNSSVRSGCPRTLIARRSRLNLKTGF
jgi:HSP20 family protein